MADDNRRHTSPITFCRDTDINDIVRLAQLHYLARRKMSPRQLIWKSRITALNRTHRSRSVVSAGTSMASCSCLRSAPGTNCVLRRLGRSAELACWAKPACFWPPSECPNTSQGIAARSRSGDAAGAQAGQFSKRLPLHAPVRTVTGSLPQVSTASSILCPSNEAGRGAARPRPRKRMWPGKVRTRSQHIQSLILPSIWTAQGRHIASWDPFLWTTAWRDGMAYHDRGRRLRLENPRART